jgi:hypothetical protein
MNSSTLSVKPLRMKPSGMSMKPSNAARRNRGAVGTSRSEAGGLPET